MKPRPKSIRRVTPSPIPDRALIQAKVRAGQSHNRAASRPPYGQPHGKTLTTLTLPLPRTATYEHLDAERKSLLEHLDWVTHTLTICDNKKALHEIQRIADRLMRIARMTPKALDRGIEEGRLQMSDDIPF